MYTMVVIDMQNPNALISMAYVSENSSNPFAVFCEFIKYCIFTNPSDYIMLSDIRNAVSEEFGLFLPHNVIVRCLSILKNEGTIKKSNHQIKKVGTFNVEKFESDRNAFCEKETALINELIKYVAPFNINWSEDEAKKQLVKVLDGDGLAFDVFFRKKDDSSTAVDNEESIIENEIIDIDASTYETESESPVLFSDSFYVAKFVSELLKRNSHLTDYLKRICEGLMITAGVYQLPKSDAEASLPQIKGTVFYFDTRLLLRYIGCANDAAINATKELVALIKSGGGIIAYYPHTLTEMKNALSEAFECLTKNLGIKDYEMRMYAAKVRYNKAVIAAKKANLVYELEESGIVQRQMQNYSESDRLRFGFSYADLLLYMQSRLNWEQQTIENDALSIWETHMCRNGNYQDYCGTKNRLSVFVTSNARLIEIALGYRREHPNTTNISGWTVNRLPVITDVRLTCRLWNPATQVERLSLLHLTANVIAAQHPTQLYINKIKGLAEELQDNVPAYSEICLSEYFDDEVTNKIFEKTEGQEANLDITTFASTINEIAEMKAKKQEELTQKETKEKDEIKKQYEKQSNDIIEGAVEANKNKMGILKIFLLLLFKWSEIVAFVVVCISTVVSYFSGDWKLISLIVVAALILVFEKVVASNFLLKKMLKKALPKIEKRFDEKIKNRLKVAEKQYEDTILQKAKEKTDILVKCRKLLEE